MKAWINDKEFEFQEGETILHAAKRLGIFIPTLCAYLPLNHTPGTCRVCLVEVTDDRGRGQIVTACTTPLTNGMRVQTRTKRIREMQRWQVAWIFSDHDQDCASCSRHGNCELQDVALYVGLQHNSCNGRFTEKRPWTGRPMAWCAMPTSASAATAVWKFAARCRVFRLSRWTTSATNAA